MHPLKSSAHTPVVLYLHQQSHFAFSMSHVLLVSLRQETTVAACALHVSRAILLPLRRQISYFSPIAFPLPSPPPLPLSTIPELTADGVLIKSSRNRTVSKQCSTCQLSNCWALLQPLCLASEGRMRQAG